MKIKKKIDVEIEIQIATQEHCEPFCTFNNEEDGYCKLYSKNLENELIGSWYYNLRCKKCLEAFGMGEE